MSQDVVALASAAVLVLGAILRGAVLADLWGWFVVPTFRLPELGVVAAIGISWMIGLLVYREGTPGAPAKPVYQEGTPGAPAKPVLEALAGYISLLLAFWLGGYIVHLFL